MSNRQKASKTLNSAQLEIVTALREHIVEVIELNVVYREVPTVTVGLSYKVVVYLEDDNVETKVVLIDNLTKFKAVELLRRLEKKFGNANYLQVVCWDTNYLTEDEVDSHINFYWESPLL